MNFGFRFSTKERKPSLVSSVSCMPVSTVLDWKISNEQGNVIEIRMSLGEVDMQILIVPSLPQVLWVPRTARPLALQPNLSLGRNSACHSPSDGCIGARTVGLAIEVGQPNAFSKLDQLRFAELGKTTCHDRLATKKWCPIIVE